MDITISDATYSRLAAQAKGFETPEQVINRLIDVVEIDHDTRPELFLILKVKRILKKRY